MILLQVYKEEVSLIKKMQIFKNKLSKILKVLRVILNIFGIKI